MATPIHPDAAAIPASLRYELERALSSTRHARMALERAIREAAGTELSNPLKWRLADAEDQERRLQTLATYARAQAA